MTPPAYVQTEDVVDILRDIRTIFEATHDRLLEVLRSQGGSSSVQLEAAAKGPPRITLKSYTSLPLTKEDVERSLDLYGYAFRETEQRHMQQWPDTVAMLEARKADAGMYDEIMADHNNDAA
jgi:ABC-type amino acid transport substrate-binding protein